MIESLRLDRSRRAIGSAVTVAVALLALATAAAAAQLPPTQPPPPSTSGSQTPGSQTPPPAPPPDATKPADPNAPDANRIFGIIPNYGTVEGKDTVAPPITTKQSFKIAALGAFDPMVYPLVGFVAGVAQIQNSPASYGQGWSGYGKRYAVAFADNTVGSLVATGVLPSLLKQDPRYYQGHAAGFLHRFAYAASRSVVTKSRSGAAQFNLSEVGGTLTVATVSNLYYPSEERNVHATMRRWGTQAIWDVVANEFKEFWPDIRRKLGRD